MNEGTRSSKNNIEGFTIAEGTACLRVTGTISHVQVTPILEWIEQAVRSGQYRAFVLDLSQVDAVEPGVAGRLIAHCRTNNVLFDHTVIVTRSAGLIALGRAAAVVLKGVRIDVQPTRAEAMARIAAMTPVRPFSVRARRERQASGELVRPGAEALLGAEDDTKRNVG